MGVLPGNSRFQCWMCKHFPISEEVYQPPEANEMAYCIIENGLKRAGSQACPHGGLDRQRLERFSRPKPENPKKPEREPITEGHLLEEIYARCLENTNERGLIKSKNAKVSRHDLSKLEEMGLIEFRDYGNGVRPFIPRIKEKKEEFFGK